MKEPDAEKGTRKPRVSVVMCTCNGARYLREQMDSILGQDCPPSEIVVQDDLSDDGTWELLEAYRKGRPELFRLYRNETRLGFNRNFHTAILRATGDFIALADQDDIWFPSKLRLRIEGTCDNLLDLIDYLGACDDAEHDEATFKENLKQANALLHFGTYFNNGKTKQTDVFLGAKYYDTPWDTADKGYWRYEPVLSFDDSTSYFFADYFTASAFKSLVDSFNGLLDSFKELVK